MEDLKCKGVSKKMRFLKEERAQGSIEMLVLLAGAIVVVSIVGMLLKRAAQQAAEAASEKAGVAATGGT